MKGSLIVISAALPAMAVSAAFTWPDGGSVDIPSGATVTVSTAEDLAKVNKCNLVFPDKTAKVVFTTADPFTCTLTGSGTVEKSTSTSTWTLTRSQPNWRGDIVVSKGTITAASAECFGNPSDWDGGARVVVMSGASLDLGAAGGLPESMAFGAIELVLAGKGVGNKGALINTNSCDFSSVLTRVSLSAEAYVDCTFPIGFGPAAGHWPTFDMGGYAFSVVNGSELDFDGVVIVNAGDLNSMRKPVTIRLGSTNGMGFAEQVYGDKKFDLLASANVYLAATNDIPYGLRVSGKPIFYSSTLWPSVFLGPVSFDGGSSTLTISADAEPENCGGSVTLAGGLSGPGVLTDVTGGRVSVTTHNPDFAGRIEFGNVDKTSGKILSRDCSLYAKYPDFMATFANLKLTRSHVTVPYGNWSLDEIYELANAATLANGSVVAIDTEASPGGKLTLMLDETKITAPTFALGHDGSGTLEVTGPVSSARSFACFDGVLSFTGSATKNLADLYAVGNCAMSTGAVVIAERADVSIDGSLFVGGWTPSHFSQGHLVVSNALLRGSKVGIDVSSTLNGIKIVSGGQMDIGTGAVVTNRFAVGADGFEKSVGSVFQTDGEVVAWGTGVGNAGSQSCLGESGHSYWRIDGGRLEFAGYAYMGKSGRLSGVVSPVNNCQSLLEVNGGAVYSRKHTTEENAGGAAGYLSVGAAGSLAHFYMTGGTYSCDNGGVYFAMGGVDGIGTTAILTLDGPNAKFAATPTLAGQKGGTTVVNLNAGEIDAKTLMMRGGNNRDAATYASVFFNGATWKLQSGSTALLGTSAATTDLTHAFVGKGGAIIDLNGCTDCTVDVPLEDMTTGVGSCSIPDAAMKVAFAAPPVAQVIGDGWGATALTQWDRKSGRVTGIKVLNPGSGYSWAKVALRSHTWGATNDCTLVDNTGTGGGLTVIGATNKKLKLNAVNTFSGKLVVSGGATLLANAEGSIPNGVSLSLDGGTLDLGGHVATFGSLGGTGGKVVNGTVVVSGAWLLSADKLAAGDHPLYDADIEFRNSEISFTDRPLPGDYVLTEVADGHSLVGTPTLVGKYANRCVLANDGKALRLHVAQYGLVIQVK